MGQSTSTELSHFAVESAGALGQDATNEFLQELGERCGPGTHCC